MMTTTFKPRTRELKFYLLFPVVAMLLLLSVFYALGGGKGQPSRNPTDSTSQNLLAVLPAAKMDKKEEAMTKAEYYEKAERDSLRHLQLIQQDPYRSKRIIDTMSTRALRSLHVLDRRLQARSEPRQQKIPGIPQYRSAYVSPAYPVTTIPPARPVTNSRPASAPISDPLVSTPGSTRSEFPMPATTPLTPLPRPGQIDTPHIDPELEQLGKLIDKLASLQQHEAPEVEPAPTPKPIAPDTMKASTISAMVPYPQELVPGGTMTLRLLETVITGNNILSKGQEVSGQLNISGTRMQVNIQSIKSGTAILPASWQAYDMDGLPGIHIPDELGRQVARMTADQGINSLNLSTYDPSIRGQLLNAGIQSARSFLGRRVRSVRMSVPAGYRLLLKDTRSNGSSFRIVADSMRSDPIRPPNADSLTAFLCKSAKADDIVLTLTGIYHDDSRAWLRLIVKNGRSYDVHPESIDCSIRPARHLKRMAQQVVPIAIQHAQLPDMLMAGDEQTIVIGIKQQSIPTKSYLAIELSVHGSLTPVSLHILSKTWAKAIAYEKGR